MNAPVFEIDGASIPMNCLSLQTVGSPVAIGSGIFEWRFDGVVVGDLGLTLRVVFRAALQSQFVRFRYELRSKDSRKLTKSSAKDELEYLATPMLGFNDIREIRFSEFNELYHSFGLVEESIDSRHFDNSLSWMGPIVAATDGKNSLLVAYEHGSQLPDRFVEFSTDIERTLTLRAVKGNYFDGQPIDDTDFYQTIWLQLGLCSGGGDELSSAYRAFVLSSMSPMLETRKPYIFYNTWNFQERNQDWNKKNYLDSMNSERILAEIEVAHRMGVDVYVLDTGWYEKTGDWKTSTERFPEGLAPIKEKLDRFGMKLGLWFNPTVAALSSRMRKDHEDCLMTRNGSAQAPSPVWETEESQGMCLVSRYAEAFADELIRLHDEVGVSYFKWDAIHQYGCNDPGHWHGRAGNDESERSNCYGFLLGTAMANIVQRLADACPDVIVDFDITEGGRTVGLSFLSVGKYFLINNGPYYHNYDVPAPEGRNINLFFFPGPARGQICRSTLTYDRWIPSVLFLTHYFPDDPEDNQSITLASLMLGHNGIWGDLLSVSNQGIDRMGMVLALYKQVRDDITLADPVRSGPVGGSPEVHEKISLAGKGVICIFASAAGEYTYVTTRPVAREIRHTEGVDVRIGSKGRAVITTVFSRPSARIVFFGVH